MTVLGEYALWAALPVGIWGALLALLGGARGRGDLVLSAERSVYVVFALLGVASAGIIAAFLGDRFEYWYVANYSNRELGTFFKVAGLWAGQRGSLVFWALLLAFFSSLAVYLNRRRNREFMPYVTGVLLTILVFFLVVCLFATNPFERLPFAPADGRGMNVQLQTYWMTIHPPTLYLGFTSFAIPFAFAMAALITGRLDPHWMITTRRWTLASWFFLTNGIIFGMHWAYEELGWGGYWFWDPVENASLLPWLTATAFLHSVMIQENRGMLKMWNMALVVVTFVLTIFATFLTRSGLIESVHSFAQNKEIAFIFLAFLGVTMAISAALIAWRREALRSESHIRSFLSREAAFLLNNLILLGAAFAVLWGTLFPLITEGVTGQKIAVGPPFFNQVNVPIGLVLLALAGIGPVIAWRRASRRNLRKNFALPVVAGAGAIVGLLSAGARDPYALLTFGIAAFVLTIIGTEFWKGTRSRSRIEGEAFVPALVHLVARNRRRWGGYIVHAGVVLVFSAFAGQAFDVEVQRAVVPGDSVAVRSPFGHTYTLTYHGLSSYDARNMFKVVGAVSVRRAGRELGVLTSEKRFYTTSAEQPTTEVGIRSTPLEDLYLILAAVDDVQGVVQNDPKAQRATFRILVNPLVSWIWYGGLLMTLGALIAVWPESRRERSIAAAPGGREVDEAAGVLQAAD
ncbi:MAG: heme lyase CcmF/NrfE family subunit [Gemmatimonadetes bacterium]|nr:heme lyase CcmF/NrfE family subunit [Gemmatimonadota bacterium]